MALRLLLLLCLSAWTASAAAASINGHEVPILDVAGVKYVPLDAFRDSMGLELDQTIGSTLRLFGNPGVTRDVVVELTVDSTQILVNDQPTKLVHPPLTVGGQTVIPYDEFLAIFMGPPAPPSAAPVQSVSTGPSLLGVGAVRTGGITEVALRFSARPNHRIVYDPDTATLQVLLPGVTRAGVENEVAVGTPEVDKITVDAGTEPGSSVVAIHLTGEVTYDPVYDEATHRLVLRFRGPSGPTDEPSPEPGGTPTTDMRRFLSTQPIVLDPGHGGEDQGLSATGTRSEAQLALDLCLRLKPLLERGGFKVYLTRNSDVALTDLDRLVAIHQHRPAFVVSVHLDGSADPTRQGSTIYYARSPAGADGQDAFSPQKGLWGPSPQEIESARSFAQRLSSQVAELVGGRPVQVIEERALFPCARIFAPSVLIDLAYYTSAQDRALADQRAFQEKMAYSIYSALFDGAVERFRQTATPGAVPLRKLVFSPVNLPPPEKAGPAPAIHVRASRDVADEAAPESAIGADGQQDAGAPTRMPGQPASVPGLPSTSSPANADGDDEGDDDATDDAPAAPARRQAPATAASPARASGVMAPHREEIDDSVDDASASGPAPAATPNAPPPATSQPRDGASAAAPAPAAAPQSAPAVPASGPPAPVAAPEATGAGAPAPPPAAAPAHSRQTRRPALPPSAPAQAQAPAAASGAAPVAQDDDGGDGR